MPGVNPIMLKWAREKAGYTLDEIASEFHKRIEDIEAWETTNEGLVTYAQLEILAYRLYKRPIALFFFDKPPEEDEPKQSFRTLPEFEIDNLIPDTRFAIREAMAMQEALKELNENVNPSEQKIFLDLRVDMHQSIERVASRVREYLGVSLDTQMGWKNKEEALKNWRDVIQQKGIFIFKRSFKQEDISGFCLIDNQFPIIYLNNSTAPSRQIFTIFHELAHVLFNVSGVTKYNDFYITSLTGDSKEIEVFCNRFAAEFLVPSNDFDNRLKSGLDIEELVNSLSTRYKVSREVILRKLLDRQMISNEYYEEMREEWNNEFKQDRGVKGDGGNYYATQAIYLGDKYLGLAFDKYYQGRFGVEELADYLNVKVRSVAGLEQVILGKV